MGIHFEPSGYAIGATVHGVSLADVPEGTRLETLEEALEKFGVLIFLDQQDVTPAQQIAFSRCFGPLESNDMESAALAGHPEIFVIGNTGEKPVTFAPPENGGELEWHTDHIHLPVPARASLLMARATPSRGGDTCYACMYSAYDALPPDQQQSCDGLDAVHDESGLDAYLEQQGLGETVQKHDPIDPVVWPLVRKHPRSGRKALYFGNQITIGIEDWDDTEARNFISDLTEHACAPRFQYRHKWQPGQAVLWDNRRVLHAGTPYELTGEPREMHRTTIRETEPVR